MASGTSSRDATTGPVPTAVRTRFVTKGLVVGVDARRTGRGALRRGRETGRIAVTRLKHLRQR